MVDLKDQHLHKLIKTIANAAQRRLKAFNQHFNKFFTDEQYLPDAISKLLGKVEDPKQIIMDTIALWQQQIVPKA